MGRYSNRDWWSRAHMRRVRKPEGGSMIVPKQVHRDLASAQEHVASLAANFPTSKDGQHQRFYKAYECRWGEDPKDGQTAPVHWHVGQDRTAGQGEA